jgi:hypothetical protein
MALQYTLSYPSVFFIIIRIKMGKFVKHFKICEELKRLICSETFHGISLYTTAITNLFCLRLEPTPGFV